MSTPELTPIGKFRAKMDAFIKQLQSWSKSINKSKELKKFQLKYDLGMRANPEYTVRHFLELIEPFAHQIMKGDEKYFLDCVGADDWEDSLGAQLGNEWPDFTEEQRESVKNTVKLLLMLATIATKNENMRVIINQYRDTPLTFA